MSSFVCFSICENYCTLSKLKALIIEMKTELAELKRQKAEGTLPPQAPEGKKGPKKTKENK